MAIVDRLPRLSQKQALMGTFALVLEGEEWSGWIYDDEILNDSRPLGPQPTHWLDVPAAPN